MSTPGTNGRNDDKRLAGGGGGAGLWTAHCARCGILMMLQSKPNEGEVFYHGTCPIGTPPPPLTAEAVTRIAQTVAEPLWQAISRQAELITRMAAAMERQTTILEKLLR